MKDHVYGFLSKSVPNEAASSNKETFNRRVSFGIAKTQVHTFKPTDIVETVHLTSQIPRSSEDSGISSGNDLVESHSTAHFILSFAMESSPLPELIPSRPKKLKAKSGNTKFLMDSEDELSEPALASKVILPDTVVIAPNKLKVMFEIPEVADALIMPESIEVCYSLDENNLDDCFTANATFLVDRIYQFVLELEVDSDVVKSVEEELRKENDDEYDSLDSSAYYAQLIPLKWKGLLNFSVPSQDDMSWNVSVSATRIVTLDSEKRRKSDIYQQILRSEEKLAQRYCLSFYV
jgi:hypothetical protein